MLEQKNKINDSAKLKYGADTDLSRSEDIIELSDKYVEIALSYANRIKSDHLLAILLEVPTDIGKRSVLQIAMKYEIEAFLDCPRIQMIMIDMYSEFDFLNPKNGFKTSSISPMDTLNKLAIKPNEFYYCAVGRFYIESLMYVFYVIIVTAVLYDPPFAKDEGNQDHHFLTSPPVFLNIMWIFNFGYWIAEISQLVMYGRQYFNDIGNAWDILIIINWAIIATVRFGCYGAVSTTTQDSCNDNNGGPVVVHMFVFCIQSVILWSRIALIFKTNRIFGPFLLMIPAMIKDIINWMFVLSIFFIGFAFGAHF